MLTLCLKASRQFPEVTTDSVQMEKKDNDDILLEYNTHAISNSSRKNNCRGFVIIDNLTLIIHINRTVT
jgi:hypothetical protein